MRSNNLLIRINHAKDIFELRKNKEIWTEIEKYYKQGFFIGFCYQDILEKTEDELHPTARYVSTPLSDLGIENLMFPLGIKEK